MAIYAQKNPLLGSTTFVVTLHVLLVFTAGGFIVDNQLVSAHQLNPDEFSGLGVALMVDHSSLAESADSNVSGVEMSLRGFGFQVAKVENKEKSQLLEAIKQFADRVPTQSVAVVYYHGPLLMGEQKIRSKYRDAAYIVPRSFDFKSKKEVRSRCVGIHEIEKTLYETGCKSCIILADQVPLKTDVDEFNKLQSINRLGTFLGESTSFVAVQSNQPENSIAKYLRDSDQKPTSDRLAAMLQTISDHSKSTSLDAQSLLGSRPIRFVDWKYFGDQLDVGKSPGEIRVNSIGQIYCWIPAGTQTLGSPASEEKRNDDEGQTEFVVKNGFWCGKFEVTEREYFRGTKRRARKPIGKNFPFTDSRHGDAKRFADNLNKLHKSQLGGWEYAMPRESEWEYSCRAGSKAAFCFGNEPSQLSEFGNFADRSLFNVDRSDYRYASREFDDEHGGVAMVGSFRPNQWGVHDMHGNVWEWCADSYRKVPAYRSPRGQDSKKQNEKPANDLGRVIRGGSWLSYPHYCRSAMRNAKHDVNNSTHIGFRIIIRPKDD